MTHGWLYFCSNESMPGLIKVGTTLTVERTPEDRVKELFRTGVPTPFKIETAKKVVNPAQKEKILHKLLTQYTERVNNKREFFRVSIEEVKTFFDLIDGDLWIKDREPEPVSESEEEEMEVEQITIDGYDYFLNEKTGVIYHPETHEVVGNSKKGQYNILK